MRIWVPLVAAVFGTCGAFAFERQDGGDSPASRIDAKALFLANCASCHGEKGDGEGVVQHDRRARSFKDGGFSFGNTPEALFRTISTGIPGSPMPGFDGALTPDQRRAVAAYVRELGPPIEEVDTEKSVLVVADETLIVRGHLPPIGEGVPEQPRGLLIGTPAGMTFEYRTDDLRMLGVRQGEFVRRTDWTGRGGTALEPLGRVVQLVEGGDPGPTFRLGGEWTEPGSLRSKLVSTWVRGSIGGITYAVHDDSGLLATVEEHARAQSSAVGSGFTRTFYVVAGDRGCNLGHLVFDGTELKHWHALGWAAYEVEAGLFRFLRIEGKVDRLIFDEHPSLGPRTAWGAGIELEPGASASFTVTSITTTAMDKSVLAKLRKELGR